MAINYGGTEINAQTTESDQEEHKAREADVGLPLTLVSASTG